MRCLESGVEEEAGGEKERERRKKKLLIFCCFLNFILLLVSHTLFNSVGLTSFTGLTHTAQAMFPLPFGFACTFFIFILEFLSVSLSNSPLFLSLSLLVPRMITKTKKGTYVLCM